MKILILILSVHTVIFTAFYVAKAAFWLFLDYSHAKRIKSSVEGVKLYVQIENKLK